MKPLQRFALIAGIAAALTAIPCLGLSAQRFADETFEGALERHWSEWDPQRHWTAGDKSALYQATRWEELDTSTLPVLEPVEDVFALVRDTRFLFSRRHLQFARRSSWLYPQDGCWIRAALARRLAKTLGYPNLAKAFIFGQLAVDTPNAPGGRVSWWYHVVPAFQNDKGQAMVFDPAIDPAQALTLEQWALTMVPSLSAATYALCSAFTYRPGDPCHQTDENADERAARDQEYYLDREWDGLEGLGRQPKDELGDRPPWFSLP